MSVLAAIDIDHEPERPLSVAYDIATAFDETLIVMYVMPQQKYIEEMTRGEERGDVFNPQDFSIEQAVEYATEQLRETIDDVLGRSRHVPIEPHARVGTPADEMLEAAESLEPRLVVVGGRRRSPARQALFGSVSHAIVRGAEQPVVTVMEANGS